MGLHCKACGTQLRYVMLAADHISNCGSFAGNGNDAATEIRTNPQSTFTYFITTAERQRAIAAEAQRLEEEREIAEAMAAASDHFYYHKQTIEAALASDEVRPSVKEQLIAILNSDSRLREFEYRPFRDRLAICGLQDNARVFYRKISGGEWDAIKNEDNPFAKVFQYQTGSLYRYWMSSSIAKVRAFGNENASDADEHIIRIAFTRDPWGEFTMRAHQQPGVQADDRVVAVHREGFAEIGNVGSKEDLDEIGDPSPRLDHNLGFTRSQLDRLKGILDEFGLHR